MSRYNELLREFERFAPSAASTEVLMDHVAQRLHEKMAHYNWVGFYLLGKGGTLNLGPFSGSFTPLKSVPLDKGLCGAAASGKRTVLVNNVADDPRYLAGSEMVKSEIVVPILLRNEVVGELDINSYFANSFTHDDQYLIESCAALVARYL